MNKLPSSQRLLDLGAILLSSSLAYFWRFDSLIVERDYLFPLIYFGFASYLCLTVSGIYQKSKISKGSDVYPNLVRAILLAALLASASLYLTKTGETYSRLWFTLMVIISAGIMLVYRTAFNALESKVIRKRKIIVLGENKLTNKIKALSDRTDSKIELRAVFTEEPTNKQTIEQAADFVEQIRKNEDDPIAEVWVTQPIYSSVSSNQLENLFQDSAARLVYVPDLPDSIHENSQFEFVGGIPTIDSELSHQQKKNSILKTLLDQAIAWPMTILLSPLMLLTTIMIKLESPGPAFYKQVRYGVYGKEFLVWKFRTMTVTEASDEFKQATKDDPRVTRVGKWLRRYSIDELPQLFNVIGGSMSLVGPRPHPNKLNEDFRAKVDGYMGRHEVKPGITGLAQISGSRGETKTTQEMQTRIELDLIYIRSWSLWLDLKILARTLLHISSNDQSY